MLYYTHYYYLYCESLPLSKEWGQADFKERSLALK